MDRKEALEKRLSSDVTTPSSYNYEEILAKAVELRKQDHHFSRMLPNYYDPIEVRPSPGWSKGTFVTHDIQAGTLIIAEKALGVINAGDIKRLSVVWGTILTSPSHPQPKLDWPTVNCWRNAQSSSENVGLLTLFNAVHGLFGGVPDALKAGSENCSENSRARAESCSAGWGNEHVCKNPKNNYWHNCHDVKLS